MDYEVALNIQFQSILTALYEKDIQSVFIEGGAHTLQSFIDANLWDECFVYRSQDTWHEGLAGPKIKNPLAPIERFEDNVLFHGKNQL